MNGTPLPQDRLAALLTDGLWARIMSGAPTKARPLKSATLILLDGSGSEIRLLMGRRHAGHNFMPGAYVFPGGRLEPCDRAMPGAGALDGITEAKLLACLQRPSPATARALALAAIRETFEETGLLLGTSDYGRPEKPPEGGWTEFAAAGVFPVLEDLHFIGRAITPPRHKRRFDTFFFATDASGIAARVDGKVGEDSEFVELRWVTFEEARTLSLPVITDVMLHELQHRLSGGLSRFMPVPVYRAGRKGWLRQEV